MPNNTIDCYNCGGAGFSVEGGDCPACEGTCSQPDPRKTVRTRPNFAKLVDRGSAATTQPIHDRRTERQHPEFLSTVTP